MGKKNKASKQLPPKDVVDTVKQKGASSISKAKDHAQIKSKDAGVANKKSIKDKPKIVDEKKIEAVNVGLANKKKNQKNNKAKQNGAKNKSPAAKNESVSPKQENGQADEKIVKLSKREMNRVKSKMSKDIAMDGKSKLGLADPKLIARQLNKLKAATEPLSKAKQRKLLLLEKLHKKLQKTEVKTPNTTINSSQSDDSDMGDSDASESSTPKKPKGKKEKSQAKKEKSEARKQKDKLYLFVGNLPANVTEEMIKEMFKAVVLEKVKIPTPRRKKSKLFAFIKLTDEESKQKALQLHGTLMGEKKITVLMSNKGKGKSALMSANAKLNAERKGVVTVPKDKKPANGNIKKANAKKAKKQKNKP